MAWYTDHQIRFHGRLVRVSARYGCLQDAVVVIGKPLCLREGSKDWEQLRKLFNRSSRIQREVQSMFAEMFDD